MKSKIEKPPPSPLELKDDLPKQLAKILSCALAKVPQDRYQSTETFMTAIDEIEIDTHSAKSDLNEIIHTYQLIKEKNIKHSPLFIDISSNQEAPFSTIFDHLKKRLLSYTDLILGRLSTIFSHNIWLGPLILLLSLIIVLGIFLQNDEETKTLTKNKDGIVPRTGSEQKNTNTKESYDQITQQAGESTYLEDLRQPKKNRPTAQPYLDVTPSSNGSQYNTAKKEIPETTQRKKKQNIVSEGQRENSNGWVIHKENEKN
jgi:hypothetical protein